MTSAVSTTAFSGVRIVSEFPQSLAAVQFQVLRGWEMFPGIVMRHVHLLVAIAKLI